VLVDLSPATGGTAAVELANPERDDLLTVASREAKLAELRGQERIECRNPAAESDPLPWRLATIIG